MNTHLLLNDMLLAIQLTNRMSVLKRLRELLCDDFEPESEGERRLDVLFVWSHNAFPDDDFGLVEMYVTWIEDTFDMHESYV